MASARRAVAREDGDDINVTINGYHPHHQQRQQEPRKPLQLDNATLPPIRMMMERATGPTHMAQQRHQQQHHRHYHRPDQAVIATMATAAVPPERPVAAVASPSPSPPSPPRPGIYPLSWPMAFTTQGHGHDNDHTNQYNNNHGAEEKEENDRRPPLLRRAAPAAPYGRYRRPRVPPPNAAAAVWALTTATTASGAPSHSDIPLRQRNIGHNNVWGNSPSDNDHHHHDDDETRRRRAEGTASVTAPHIIDTSTAIPHSVTTFQDEYQSDDGDAYDDNDDYHYEPAQQDVVDDSDAVSYAEPEPDLVASAVATAASGGPRRRSSQGCFDAALARALDQVLPAGDPDALRDFTEQRIAQFTGTHLVRLLTLTAAAADNNGWLPPHPPPDHHHHHHHSHASADRHVLYR